MSTVNITGRGRIVTFSENIFFRNNVEKWLKETPSCDNIYKIIEEEETMMQTCAIQTKAYETTTLAMVSVSPVRYSVFDFKQSFISPSI